MKNFCVILFHDFETLDVFGPVEVMGKLNQHYRIEFYSEHGGLVTSSQNVKVQTLPITELNGLNELDVLLIPGGIGTRSEVNNQAFIQILKQISNRAQFVLTVCTGAALLARTGLLKNRKATTNKMAFDWVANLDQAVQWIRKARWVADGKYYTSSGVSAGIDMTLGFIGDIIGMEAAERISTGIEYIWNKDRNDDPFC